MSKTLDWIKDVRKGHEKVLMQDAGNVLKIIEKKEFESKTLLALLDEIKEVERDDALLSLVQAMLEEDIRNIDKEGKKQ